MNMISLDTRVKLLQAFVYVGFIYTLAYQFDLILFLISFFIIGWLMTLIGISCGLHKYSAHNNFKEKHVAFKILMLFYATVMSLGSSIAWSSTHRKHHQTSDKLDDPHSPNTSGGGLWRSIKLWFYYFPTYHVNPRIVKDLSVDPIHKFFHKNYFKIVAIYVILLSLFGIKAVCYLYFVPVVYGFQATSYITVLAHNTWLAKFGYRNFNTEDKSFNSKLAAIFCPCDGNHNNHHGCAGAATNSLKPGDWDTGYWFIRLIGRVPDQSVFKKFNN
jgi:stearoyl-CoA desaturase (delta-9 desaturase)